jgi:N-acetylmuramoyl-L-alanine amidase
MSTLYLLKRLEGPAVIAEVGFISNPTEAAHLAQPTYQKHVALAIYSAVLRYFGNPDPEEEPLHRPSLSEVTQ